MLRNFLHAVPKLPGDFNPREVVYRQMEVIRAETMGKMNELLEGDVTFVNITGYSWTANHQHFLSIVVVHRINSDFKNHLVLPFLCHLQKLDLIGRSGDYIERVFESVAATLLVRGLLLQQQTIEPQHNQRNER